MTDQEDTTEYVVGFAFDWDGRVALIRKNRPEWQAGRLNGIGGHVESGERPDDAMEREFWEETATRLTAWDRFVVMDFPGARIHFYRLLELDPRVLDGLITATDEQVCLVWPGDANQHLMIPNLTWLIPLARYTADTYEPVHVRAAMAEALTRVLPPEVPRDRAPRNYAEQRAMLDDSLRNIPSAENQEPSSAQEVPGRPGVGAKPGRYED